MKVNYEYAPVGIQRQEVRKVVMLAFLTCTCSLILEAALLLHQQWCHICNYVLSGGDHAILKA